MIYGRKLLSLVEQANNHPDKHPDGYEGTFRKMLGLVRDPVTWALKFEPKAQEFSAKDFNFQELTESFLGRHGRVSESEVTEQMQRLPMVRAQIALKMAEAEGHVVLPSHFAHISAYSSTVVGLLDAMALEAYQSPVFIGDQIFQDEETRMNGGKRIGIMNDGQWGDDLIDGEPYPTVGLKETYVSIPDNQRRGNTIQLNVKDLIYDRTGTVQEKAVMAGDAPRRGKEIKEADVFVGAVNPFSRDGQASNTYLDAAGAVPNNFVNSRVLPLDTFLDIDTAAIMLQSNVDPGTGFEIEMPEPYQVAVFPHQWMQLLAISRSTEVETRLADGTSTQIRRFQSPLVGINPVKLSMLWYNRALAAIGSASPAQNRWWISSDFKRTFRYRTLIPYQTREAPLSSEDVRRDIVLVRVALEHGVPYVLEPRYTGMLTEEDITP